MYNTQPLPRTPRPRITVRVVAYLAAHGPTHVHVLAHAVQAYGNSVEMACYKLAKQGHVRRTAPGTYALTQEAA